MVPSLSCTVNSALSSEEELPSSSKMTRISIIAYKLAFVTPAVTIIPPIGSLGLLESYMCKSRSSARSRAGIVEESQSGEGASEWMEISPGIGGMPDCGVLE